MDGSRAVVAGAVLMVAVLTLPSTNGDSSTQATQELVPVEPHFRRVPLT